MIRRHYFLMLIALFAGSAAWAVTALTATGIAAGSVARISQLIVATKHTAALATGDTAYLLDVDLSILGQSAADFDAYDLAIRQEYEWVPEPDYREARARILNGFLQRPTIFQTSFFQSRLEQPARDNLRHAIDRLLST